LIMGCFAVLSVVADQVVAAATRLVSQLPVSASFFGVICLGVASTLPELTTSLISIVRGQKEIAAGILIGSAVTNPLVGIGLGGLISSYMVPRVVAYYDAPAMILVAGLLYVFLRRHEDLNKAEAVALILLYCGYLLLRFVLFPNDIPLAG
jgi:cation:H+ antiporter